MALTATRVSKGFEPVRHLLGQPMVPREYELTPNTAFSQGDMVVLTNGLVAKAAANATNVLGSIAEAFTTTTNPSAATTMGRVYDDPNIVFRCTFSDHLDSTATGGTTTTLVDTALSTSTDNDWRGAYVYIYDGTNKGIARTVKSYTGSSDTLTFEEAFPAACDTTTKYIMLGVGGAANNDVINVGKIGVDLKDENTIDGNATVANEAGPLKVEKIIPLDLMMDVTIRKHIYKTP